jgi:hypothetical protein
MPTLPNPFDEFTGDAEHAPVDKAVAFDTPVLGAAADPFDGPDIPLAELSRRGFDVWKFMDALPPPLHADDLIPVLQVLAGDTLMADIEPIRAAIARH